MSRPLLSIVVVHWRDEASLADLLDGRTQDPDVEWIVIDNSGTTEAADGVRWIRPPRNLGFAGGANLGTRIAESDLILLLNPDARPREEALRALIEAAEKHPEATGFAPRLIGADGRGQWSWQLRPLPRPGQLLLHALFLDPVRGPEVEPPPGTRLGQPAAAALALRRSGLESVAGFDPRFRPAWFEDVDLACRLAAEDLPILYAPESVVVHGMGGSVPSLGYGGFLTAYYRNLERYLARHAPKLRPAVRPLLVLGMGLRLLLLPIRRPRRAPDRFVAARGLLGVIAGAVSGWKTRR